MHKSNSKTLSFDVCWHMEKKTLRNCFNIHLHVLAQQNSEELVEEMLKIAKPFRHAQPYAMQFI